MENMARLALLEQNLKKLDIFDDVLKQLYQIISDIIDDPHDDEAKVVTNKVLLKALSDCKVFCDYMEYIGFEKVKNKYMYTKHKNINSLKTAYAALEKKIFFVNATKNSRLSELSNETETSESEEEAWPLPQKNSLLQQIEKQFNTMLIYEDEKLLKEAKAQLPLVTLQTNALKRMREHQKKIKTGETNAPDMAFDTALLMELLGWFKYEFFKWVNAPECVKCGPTTRHVRTVVRKVDGETCSVEEYACTKCGVSVNFPRYNDPGKLLRTRRGRCGEWANCFVLFCRALDYDTRFVYSTTDHVWCEVSDVVTRSWLHVDPCEGVLDAPLMYSHGWGHKLSYVLAFSRDDLQDVTWRYTTQHKEVLSRRNVVSETDLLHTILRLRAARQKELTPARKRFLAIRNITELASLMVERKPTDYEGRGRISGSVQWRSQRGEIGKFRNHSFVFDQPGDVSIQYCTSSDKYLVVKPGGETQVQTWAAGVHQCKDVFRKVEDDWRQVYLARVEGESTGSISWQIKAEKDLMFNYLVLRVTSALYETGRIDWTVQFDDEHPTSVSWTESVTEYDRPFRTMTLRAELSGGVGDVAWQHAQLFRQSLDARTCTFEIQARLVAD